MALVHDRLISGKIFSPRHGVFLTHHVGIDKREFMVHFWVRMKGNYRRYSSYGTALLILTVVWGIWNESFGYKTVLEGFVLSILVLVLTNRFLLKAPYQERYRIDAFTTLRYVGVLIVEIFRSGIHAIHITLTDRINVGVVDLPTTVSDPLIGTLVASAITLTPGTVTVDYDRTRFKVIWIDCVTNDPLEAGESIKGGFERVFERSVDRSGENHADGEDR